MAFCILKGFIRIKVIPATISNEDWLGDWPLARSYFSKDLFDDSTVESSTSPFEIRHMYFVCEERVERNYTMNEYITDLSRFLT